MNTQTKIDKIDKVIMTLLKVLGLVGGILFVIMMFGTSFDVIGRKFLGTSIPGVYETVQFILMPMAVFCGLPGAYASGIMPRVGDAIKKAPPTFQKVAAWIVFIFEIIVFGLLSYYSVKFCINGFVTLKGETIGRHIVHTYPFYIMVPAGFILTLVMCFWTRIKNHKI